MVLQRPHLCLSHRKRRAYADHCEDQPKCRRDHATRVQRRGRRARLRATSPDRLESPFLGGNTFNGQKAGYLVAHGLRPAPNDDPEITRLYGITKRVWERWHAMEGTIWERWHAMEGTNVPLTHNTAGCRDFDINIDGVAHYGLLPDFLQDVCNAGLTQRDLGPLFRSAEEYIRTWERCERQRGRV